MKLNAAVEVFWERDLGVAGEPNTPSPLSRYRSTSTPLKIASSAVRPLPVASLKVAPVIVIGFSSPKL